MDTSDLLKNKGEEESQSKDREELQESHITDEELEKLAKECPTYEDAIRRAADTIAHRDTEHLGYASLAYSYLLKQAIDKITNDMTLSKENAEKKFEEGEKVRFDKILEDIYLVAHDLPLNLSAEKRKNLFDKLSSPPLPLTVENNKVCIITPKGEKIPLPFQEEKPKTVEEVKPETHRSIARLIFGGFITTGKWEGKKGK